MASLLELLFETMPLAGARQEVTAIWNPGHFERVPIHALKVHVVPYSASQLDTLAHTNVDSHPDRHTDGTPIPRESQSIWSYEAGTTVYSAEKIQCRSAQEGFSNCLVLERIEFGGDYGKGFDNSVEIALPSGAKRQLRLSESALIATFKVSNGSTTAT